MAMRILLLEDDPSLAVTEREILELDQHTVASTPSGVEALAMAAREHFDLALLDVEVEELSGLGVGRVLHDLGNVPVIVMSGRPNGWRREALQAGAVACLQKPFDVRRLVELTRAVEASGRTDAPFPGDVRMLTPGDLDQLEKMSRSEIDALPFGAIRLDREGHIVAYNAFEAEAAGFAQRDMIGRRFVEVAPCIVVKEFVAAVERVRSGEPIDEVLRFVFPHHGAACVVSVRLYLAKGDDRLWLLVSKRTGPRNGTSPTAA